MSGATMISSLGVRVCSQYSRRSVMVRLLSTLRRDIPLLSCASLKSNLSSACSQQCHTAQLQMIRQSHWRSSRSTGPARRHHPPSPHRQQPSPHRQRATSHLSCDMSRPPLPPHHPPHTPSRPVTISTRRPSSLRRPARCASSTRVSRGEPATEMHGPSLSATHNCPAHSTSGRPSMTREADSEPAALPLDLGRSPIAMRTLNMNYTHILAFY